MGYHSNTKFKSNRSCIGETNSVIFDLNITEKWLNKKMFLMWKTILICVLCAV